MLLAQSMCILVKSPCCHSDSSPCVFCVPVFITLGISDFMPSTLHMADHFHPQTAAPLLSLPFITHPLCSITILINLTSAHIRTAISFLLLTKTLVRTHKNVTDWHALARTHAITQTHFGKENHQMHKSIRSPPEPENKYKQMSASQCCIGLFRKWASFYLL